MLFEVCILQSIKIIVALNDPKRKDGMMKELLDNVRIIEDENGEKENEVSVGGLFMHTRLFTLPNRQLRETWKMSLRDDDIILATAPKTGADAFF